MPHEKTIPTGSTLRDFTKSSLSGDWCEELPAAFNVLQSLPQKLFVDALFWFPRGVPNGKSVALVGSRLGQNLEEKASLFDALRTFACRTDPSEIFLITADGLATDEFVTRLSQLFSIPRVRFVQAPKSIDQTWIENAGQTSNVGEIVCFYQLPALAGKRKNEIQAAKDHLIALAAKELRVLTCREKGNTAKAIFSRLAGRGDTRVLCKEQLIRKNLLDQFVERGASAWMLLDDTKEQQPKTPQQIDVPILTLDEIDTSRYLLHCTRRCAGQWPGQTRGDYLDDLIFGAKRANHDPLAALCRILATDRIIATNSLTRDPTRVVCLSEVALDKLEDMKTFRSHLSRWDFLPFGIAIERGYLKSSGAKKVNYGSEADWAQTKSEARPYFQLTHDAPDQVDWSVEKEWRLRGDLILKNVDASSAVVFVPTLQDAEVIASISRWPIVVLSN